MYKKAVLGKKLGMCQITDKGLVVTVTVVEVEPMFVVQKKYLELDGYNAIQVAVGDIKKAKLSKPIQGHLAKSKCPSKRYLKEIQVEDYDKVEVGSIIKCDVFKVGDMVDVQGKTKGRGFTGTIKRWNGRRLKMTHGTGPVHRSRGSSGAHSDPSRVFKGLKMAGQYGNETVTIRNLKIVKIYLEKNILLISGALPGSNGSRVLIKNSQ